MLLRETTEEPDEADLQILSFFSRDQASREMTDESNRNHLFLTAILFVFVARFYRGKTYIQGEAPVEEAATAR